MSSSSSVQSIEEDDVLCRTCYEKELSRLNLHNTSLKNIEEAYEDMHIAERSVKRRCTRNLVFVESSDDDSLLEKSFESSLLQTSREDEESDGIEDEVRQSKAKNLLNAVFEVLGLPKVSDWRTMGSMRRSVTRAIEIIKETANEIDAASESTKSKNVSLSVSETDILLDGMKLLFKSSDYDEQTRLLTLSPPYWGRPQIQKFFSCNEWQARRAIELRSSFGILAKITNFSGNPPIDPTLLDEIEVFFQDDAISRQTSNKKEVIHINKQPTPIRYMTMTVGQAYTIFLKNLEARNSLCTVSKTVFYSCRPKWVKILTPHDVCACIFHENYEFLIKAWNKLGTLKIDSKMLINNIVCQLPAEKCFFGECAACKDSVPSAFLEPLLGQHSRFDDSTWMIWSKPRTPPTTTENLSSKTPTSNQILLQKVNGSIADLLEEFDAQWLTFLKHSYITTEQSNYIRTIKNGASESDTIVVHMDFAENYSLQQQNSIMQAHWTTPQATIFTIHIKVDKDNHHSMAIISDYLEHNVEFVHAAQNIIVDYVQSLYPSIKKLNYVSDGAPQHFKNNKSILNLTYHYNDFGIPASWSFCATAHGKSAVDGIGAAIKHRANKQALYANSSCTIFTPEDLYKFARQNTAINVFYMHKNRIQQNSEKYHLCSRWNQRGVEGKYQNFLIQLI
ncbi:unnamed protein product [Rotaria magnacalcarata]|uniref:Uncharacterized protein n=1 Tax=Rotaria magnacalcarata TaxID=392030 RepID=A0A816XH19_9BILA|nr:unnamed protein product [Rotaria magnacalcarata]